MVLLCCFTKLLLMLLKKINLAIVGLVIMLGSCTTLSRKPQNVTLSVITTTDVHGMFFPYDYIENKTIPYSLAHFSTFVNNCRAQNPDGTILLDNGDVLQGQPFIYYHNFIDTTGIHMGAQIFNFLRYDAATVGNHDIETGHPVYDKFNSQLNCNWLAANIVNTETGEPYFKPYSIIERKGVKIAVLGLTTPSIGNWLPPVLWNGMAFNDMIETAKHWVNIINQTEKPDLLIGLFHAGLDYTYNGQADTTYKNENATVLVAQQVPGFDIIFAGHDHKMVENTTVNCAGDTVYIIDANCYAKYAGVANINLQFDKKLCKYKKTISTSLVNLSGYEPDTNYINLFGKADTIVRNYVNRQIGFMQQPITTRDSYFGPSAFMELVHNVQLSVSGAQVSFAAPLSFNVTINKGPVYVSDLFKLYKYENSLYTLSLTGSEIDSFLEFAANQWFNQMLKPGKNLLALTYDKNGKAMFKNQYYNFSSAAGINYVIDVTKPLGNRVTISGFTNGSNFSYDTVYTVAMNSYRASGGGGHLTIGVGLSADSLQSRLVSATSHDIRYYMLKYIENKKNIELKVTNNWQILPRSYYKNSYETDYNQLFSKN